MAHAIDGRGSVKALSALAIVAVLGVLGFQLAGPSYDAAARSICSRYATERGLVLTAAYGSPPGRLAFTNFPDYSCRFTDAAGNTSFVDEDDRLIQPTWAYRGFRLAGWLTWTSAVASGVGLSWHLGLLPGRTRSSRAGRRD